MNLSLLLLLMTQSPVQHMTKSMIYLLWKAGIGLGTLPRKIKSLQGQSSNARSASQEIANLHVWVLNPKKLNGSHAI